MPLAERHEEVAGDGNDQMGRNKNEFIKQNENHFKWLTQCFVLYVSCLLNLLKSKYKDTERERVRWREGDRGAQNILHAYNIIK